MDSPRKENTGTAICSGSGIAAGAFPTTGKRDNKKASRNYKCHTCISRSTSQESLDRGSGFRNLELVCKICRQGPRVTLKLGMFAGKSLVYTLHSHRGEEHMLPLPEDPRAILGLFSPRVPGTRNGPGCEWQLAMWGRVKAIGAVIGPAHLLPPGVWEALLLLTTKDHALRLLPGPTG